MTQPAALEPTLPAASAADTAAASPDAAPGTVKTAFDCDVLTLARAARPKGKQHQADAASRPDPLQAQYGPLGNRDIISIMYGR